ncbi:MAG: AAA family ATPase [Deltaproteobacteria bacterium]|nr:AAA family ATPase [Deltaproteobacteria bacterium]
MPLNAAHEGYEYQDLLTSYFILKEILDGNDSSFKIDTKEYPNDKFDDLTITNSLGIFKKQIKYSNEKTNRQLQKKNLSSKTSYELHLDALFHSWNNHPNKNKCEFRICLAWQEPIDDLNEVLKQHSTIPSFPSYTTQTFKIDVNKLWPSGQKPLKNWKRFREENAEINRLDFENFCEKLIIETNFPKQSPNTEFSGELENVLLDQIGKLGIGEFPNDRIESKAFALELIQLIRRSRSLGLEINSQTILNELNIQTDYGSIEQVFPIDNQKNIETKNAISKIKTIINNENRIILIGEPGSGKSWFIQNLQHELQNEKYNIVKHYCYTELKDKNLKDRIKLNVFYGNLINDIVNVFPDLEEKKEQRYASNLKELNNLLQNIYIDTIIIIDGLDHVDRVFEFSQSDLTRNDVQIIKAITQLKPSGKVKIFVVSQPIQGLIQLSNYKRVKIPCWKIEDVKAYLTKINVSDSLITENKYLSDFLLEKSNGNPLYLNYLTEEVKKLPAISTNQFNSLPSYSYNLKEYYQYLLKKLNFDSIVPQALSGANFSLSKNELKEITKQGNKVDNAIDMLSPLLKENLSTGGFIIYHESFRRFIIEKLKEEEVEIEAAIFRPLIEWFKEKGFFNFSKAYRYYFQLLYENQMYDKILSFLSKDFVTESVYYGHSFDAIKNNYKYLAKSALKQKNFSKIILASEINKVLSSTEGAYSEGFTLYLSALGYLKGFKALADHLVFEGKPALPLLLGLEACYLCNQNKEPAPWDLYFAYFNKNQEISVDDFKYYIRGLLILKETEILIKVSEDIFNKYLNYIKSFKNELSDYHDAEYINELKGKSSVFNKILICKPKIKPCTKQDLLTLSNDLLNKENMFENDLPLLSSFFKQVENHINDFKLIEQIIKIFISKNWFYNWIIYFIKIKSLQAKQDISFFEVKEAFQFLIYDTEPFKGNPRTCDLYGSEYFIYDSIAAGLIFIKSKEEWNEIVELLIKLSEETTTSMRKNLGGPLPTDKLFQLLDENANKVNRKKIIEAFERLIVEKQDYNLHSYIAEYYFRLSKQYSITGEKEKAEQRYNTGIKLFLGYTFWKDISLEDVANSIESLYKFDRQLGNDNIKKLKSLVDSVSSHTSGKGTSHFPTVWFQKFLNINFNDASKYILTELCETGYSWVDEEQLQDLLIKANGQINSLIELFIYRTFPVESSEDFLFYGLTLVEKNKNIDYELAKQLLASLFVKSNNRRNEGFSDNYSEKLKKLLIIFGFENFASKVELPHRKEYRKKISKLELLKENSVSRKQFPDMTIQEQIEYFSNYKIKETDLISLYYCFDRLDALTPEIKALIEAIVEKNEEYPKNEDLEPAVVFEKDNNISAYYWICRFVHERDGWYRNLINVKAFKKAYSLNPELTINSFVELFSNLSKIGFTSSFSSNLLNALIEIEYKPDIIQKIWKELYSAAEFRLPVIQEIDWNKMLADDLDMNIEEIFICILFARFNSNTTERHHWTLSGLVYLYQLYPKKMIKPTKWFLKNNKQFLKANLLIILEILYDINNENLEYYKNFKDELNKLYPSNYYLIDYIIGKLLCKSRIVLIKGRSLVYSATHDDINFFKKLNYRNEILNNMNFDFETVVAKHKATVWNKYKEKFELFKNRSIDRDVKIIYPYAYLLELINTELYNQFSKYDVQAKLYDVLQIHYKTIVAQTNSYSIRPLEIDKPHLIKTNWQKSEVAYSDWIRLGYYEYELYEESFGKNNEYRVFEGIAFKNNVKESIPFSCPRFFPTYIWDNISMIDFDEFLCLFLTQFNDQFEDYKILWINPILLNELNVQNPITGLNASNSKNEVVLKYNRWSSDYVGDGNIAGISDEIPRLEGAELICRKDYFEKICKFYKSKKPYLYALKLQAINKNR